MNQSRILPSKIIDVQTETVNQETHNKSTSSSVRNQSNSQKRSEGSGKVKNNVNLSNYLSTPKYKPGEEMDLE